jgi:hypothetical protein
LIGRSRVVRNAVDVELGGISGWAVDDSQGGQKAQGGRSYEYFLEKLHLFSAQSKLNLSEINR